MGRKEGGCGVGGGCEYEGVIDNAADSYSQEADDRIDNPAITVELEPVRRYETRLPHIREPPIHHTTIEPATNPP